MGAGCQFARARHLRPGRAADNCGCWRFAGQSGGFGFSLSLGWLGCSEMGTVCKVG